MNSFYSKVRRISVYATWFAIAAGPAACLPVGAGGSPVRILQGTDAVEVQAIAPNIVRIHLQPNGQTTPRTLVMDPALQPLSTDTVRIEKNGVVETLTSTEMKVMVNGANPFSVEVQDAGGRTLLTLSNGFGNGAASGRAGGPRQRGGGGATIVHDENESIWGIKGLDMGDSGLGILRNTGGSVAAGVQGGAGGPFFFTKRYGVLVDSDGGAFQAQDDTIRFQRGSRPDVEVFCHRRAADAEYGGPGIVDGPASMPPKWTLGFLNSQWISTEAEWRALAETYAQKSIPISGFIFDFDWKAWGEDDYGEWRWNSTSGEGNSGPNKFPNGASGKFATEMQAKGIYLSGILKPRILMTRRGRPADQGSRLCHRA